jgi:hypothetical protein
MRAFDKSIGVGNGYTSKQYKSKASVGSDVLERIFDTYPELNPLWLLRDDGNMIIEVAQESELKEEGKGEENHVLEPSSNYIKEASFDKLLESKIEHIVTKKLQTITDKLENLPTLEEVQSEILKHLKDQ